jgi:ribosome-associated protein
VASKDLVVKHIIIPAAELDWTACRASGPGGQNVNKVSSKVELRFDLAASNALSPSIKQRLAELAGSRLAGDGKLVVTSQVTRDQARNLDDARAKLAVLIERALHVPKRRKPTKPSRAARERRLSSKSRLSEKKQARSRRADD